MSCEVVEECGDDSLEDHLNSACLAKEQLKR